jgi:hypothetical protein
MSRIDRGKRHVPSVTFVANVSPRTEVEEPRVKEIITSKLRFGTSPLVAGDTRFGVIVYVHIVCQTTQVSSYKTHTGSLAERQHTDWLEEFSLASIADKSSRQFS